MSLYKLLFILLFTLLGSNLFAATFIVTSNADAGAGTLRQALLDAAANGTAVTDYINFNLPGTGQAAVTITLQTQLPDVTANVVIDGTTQPGGSLGVSNAKVIVTPAVAAANFSAFNVSNAVGINDAVEFYGLYIMGFSPNQPGLGNGIVTNADCKLVIGAPGKGNVISGNGYAMAGYFQNAIIQDNFIGVQPDGKTLFTNSSVLYSAQDYNNLLIGGDATQGNVIVCGQVSGINLGGGTSVGTPVINISNNSFGTDYTQTSPIGTSTVASILINDANATLNVTANVFSATGPGISAVNKSTIVVKGNYFGTNTTQSFSLGSGTQAILEDNGVNATIGGTSPADQNVFILYLNPIVATNNCVTNVIQNTFYCNQTVQLNDPSGKNFVTLTTLTATAVGGDAPAGASVQLYYTDTQCTTCNPRTWFATVTADATGAWQYNGAVSIQNVIASSTVNNNTVGFQIDSLAQDEVNITNYDCHHAGSIAFKQPRQGRFQFTWQDASGNTVATTQTASNLQPGTYTLTETETGSCPSVTGTFKVIDLTPKVFSSTFKLNCTNPTAFFTAYPTTGPGITVTAYNWQDSTGAVISTTNTVTGLSAGKYTLYITDSDGCNSAKAVFTVLPPQDTPVIDDSSITITDADCSLADGSITGLQLTNAAGANYGWDRADGSEQSFGSIDLKNAPPGQYYFYVIYNFNCPTLKSKLYTIGNQNVIAIDASAETSTSSTCSNSNGAITGIQVTNASKYQWFDNKNNLVATTPNSNLSNVPAGSYYLVASNQYCSLQSAVFNVGNIAAFNAYQSTFVTTEAYCGKSNGGVNVTFNAVPAPQAYRWADAAGSTIISNSALINEPAGTYQLFVTDSNGCESLYKTYTVSETPVLQMSTAGVQTGDDQCLHGVGSITNVAVTGGLQPYAYTWLNADKQMVSTSLDLTNVKQGVYTLQVTDATGCDLATQDFTVGNDVETVATPEASNVQICVAGAAIIQVKDPQPGYSYHLYDSAGGTEILGDQANGLFNVAVAGSRSYYISQYTGDCESPRIEVKVTVGATDLRYPNTFSPNNDGINDYWDIAGIENYPGVLVQIFNRYGQKVFESKGYDKPFDGKLGGAYLPAGVYYFIINLNSNCSLLSGSLTLLR